MGIERDHLPRECVLTKFLLLYSIRCVCAFVSGGDDRTNAECCLFLFKQRE